MDGQKFAIGIGLLLGSIVMIFFVEDAKGSLERTVAMCNSGWGDMMGITFQCTKIQLIYYSPWILGFFGIIYLIKARPYSGYSGAGGYGSHNRRRRLNRKQSKIIKIAVVSSVVIVLLVTYTNFDITIGDQKLDELIPIASIGNTLDEMSKSIPIKIEPKSGTSNQESTQGSVPEFATITKNLDKKPYGGATADITINKLQVVETDYYNIINMNMKLTVHMELDDMQYFSPTANWYLKNENGKQYTEQCHNSQGDFMLLKGDQNPVRYYDICYHVEKKFNTFNFHGIPITLD